MYFPKCQFLFSFLFSYPAAVCCNFSFLKCTPKLSLWFCREEFLKNKLTSLHDLLCSSLPKPHFVSLFFAGSVWLCNLSKYLPQPRFQITEGCTFSPPLQGGDVSDISLSTVFWCYAKSVTCKQCAFRMEVIHFFPLKYKHQDNTRGKKKRFVPYLKISVSKKEMAIGLWFLSLSAQWGLWAPEFLLWMDPQTTIDLSPCLHFHPLVHLWVAAFSLEKRLKEQKK